MASACIGQDSARCHEIHSLTEFHDDLWRPIVTPVRVRPGLALSNNATSWPEKRCHDVGRRSGSPRAGFL